MAMTDPPRDAPYIHTEESEEVELLRHGERAGTAFMVHARWKESKSKLECRIFTPKRFLDACWDNEFDTTCSHCGDTIDITREPPVRLLRLHVSLIITDYHLGCLEDAKVKYIAVSHAWTKSVAIAYHDGVSTDKASKLCYEVPIRTLEAVHRSVHEGHKFHLWHDYISIPQRIKVFRGPVILPRIFDIFKKADFAILHVGLHPPIEVVPEPTIESLMRNGAGLQAFFKSHIFSRLWPLVELNRVKEACIMDNSYEIMSIKNAVGDNDADENETDNSELNKNKLAEFSKVTKNVLDVMQTATNPSEWSALRWIDDLPLIFRERREQKCVGHVFDMVSKLGSRWPRDKFVAAAELLHIPEYSTKMPPVSDPAGKKSDSQDAQDACLWLLKRQLQDNDFSPLLLRPSSKPKHNEAGRFSGRTILASDVWCLGDETHPADKAPQFQEDVLRLEAMMVGAVAVEFSWRPEAAHEAAFDALKMLKRNAKQVEESTTNSLGSQESRPLPPLLQTAINPSLELVLKALGVLLKQNLNTLEKIDDEKVRSLCDETRAGKKSSPSLALHALDVFSQHERLFDAMDNIDDSEARAFSDNILSLIALSLSTPLPNLESFAKLGDAKLCRKLCDPAERYLISVRPEGCPDAEVPVFRTDLWQDPTPEARLYLIPGLGYQYSVPGGTGIIVQDEEVIGRVRFGAQTPGCNHTTPVKLI